MKRYHGMRESLKHYADARLHNLHIKEDRGPALRSLQATGIAPTALFCADDGLALTAVSELLARGYSIPEYMSVVGIGDFSAATQISPQLTTIKVQGWKWGLQRCGFCWSALRPKGKNSALDCAEGTSTRELSSLTA
jgi:LacI family transcriptional regulator